MCSLAHLLVLALAVTAVVAKGCGGRRQTPPLSMEQQFALMQESRCLPDDVATPDTTSCQNATGPTQLLQCMVSKTGISSDSGYDQTGAEAFIDSLSSDEQWKEQQKELLANCSTMMGDDLAAEKQGVFVLACWHQLMVADCNKQRLVAAAVAVDPENGEEVAETVATMAEGFCFKHGLKYSDELSNQWKTCADENDVDMQVLKAAGFYYKMLTMTNDSSLPELSAENVTAVAEELEKLEATAECYRLASGDVSSDGQINYEQVKTNIDSAKGKDEIKEAAKKIVDDCQAEDPATIDEFSECFYAAMPYECVALKSKAIASGRKPGGKRGGKRRGGGGSRGGGGGGGRGGGRGGRGGGRGDRRPGGGRGGNRG